MVMFKKGDRVRVVVSAFGSAIRKKVGVVVRASRTPFTFYNVRFPGDRNLWELHPGEIKLVRKPRRKR